MVIERGQPWGSTAICPTDLQVADDDTELARLLEGTSSPSTSAWPTGTTSAGALAVSGGDLHRTLGAPVVPTVGARCRRLPVDLLRCELDGVVRLAVAHVVVRRGGPLGWWRGPIIAVCNAQFHGRWDVAPRGHPNDGRADLVEVASGMPVRQRRLARRRLPSGTHVPHPDIVTRRVTDFDREIAPDLVVYLDRRPVRGVRRLQIEVVPDAFAVLV